MKRRAFLTGLGGVTVGLPFLESFWDAGVYGAPSEQPVFFVVVKEGNGVSMQGNGEPEMYWPRSPGALSSVLQQNTDRATSELMPIANDVLLVGGIRLEHIASQSPAGGHFWNNAALLTGNSFTASGDDTNTVADGESIDNYIARSVGSGSNEPLTLYCGQKVNYYDDVISYSAPGQRRGAEANPQTAYNRLMNLAGGGGGGASNPAAGLRNSVNDLIREQIEALKNSPRLSATDVQRLNTHQEQIQDVEASLCALNGFNADINLVGYNGEPNTLNGDQVLAIAKVHMQVVALAFKCDAFRAATIQIGTGNDITEYVHSETGQTLPNLHYISHRVLSHGGDGTPIPNAQSLHQEVDRQRLRAFVEMVQTLKATDGPQGSLLDSCVAVNTNDLAHGDWHNSDGIPMIIAGGGGGYIKKGEYIDVGNEPVNKVWNTVATACGVRKQNGDYVDSFGHSSFSGAGGLNPILV